NPVSIAAWQYSYDGKDRITRAALNSSAACPAVANTDAVTLAPAGVQCFGYDNADRLVMFREATAAHTASYDPDGNRTSYKTDATSTTQFAYGADDSLLSITPSAGPARTSTYPDP